MRLILNKLRQYLVTERIEKDVYQNLCSTVDRFSAHGKNYSFSAMRVIGMYTRLTMSSLFTAVAITLLLLFQIFYYGSYSGFAIGAIIVFYVLGFYSLPRYLAINKVLKRYEKENPKKIDRVVSS